MNNMFKIKNNFVNWLIYLIPIPFVLNFFLNLYDNELNITFLNLTNLSYSFISFIFLYNFCSLISQSLNLNNISLSVAIFYISFYVINFSTLIFDKRINSFENYFYFTILIWVIYLIFRIKMLNKFNIFFSIFSILFLNFIKDYLYSSTYKVIQLSSDTEYFWTPMSKSIYENGLFFALENNIISGYGLLINYIHAVNFKLFINEENFYFHTATTNIFLFLGIFFIWELKVNKITKIFGLSIFLSILLNSDWLSYLLINSSMGEGVVNYLFGVLYLPLVNILKNNSFKTNLNNTYLIVFFSGFLYFTKPFVSYLVLFCISIIFLKIKKLNIAIFGFLGFFINFLNYLFVISTSTSDTYLNISEFSNTKNLLNLKTENILQIIYNLYNRDKVMTLFLLILFIIVVFNILKEKSVSEITLILLLNVLLVFALYSSVWQNKELESAYRYLFSIFNLYFVLYISEIEKLFKNKS